MDRPPRPVRPVHPCGRLRSSWWPDGPQQIDREEELQVVLWVAVAVVLGGLGAVGARGWARRSALRRASAAGLEPAERRSGRSLPQLPSGRAVPRASAVLAGGGVALLLAGPGGVLAGALLGAACWRLLPGPATSEEREVRERSAALRRQLPLTADLLAACLAAWGAPAQAAAAVAAALTEPMAGRLRLVAAELAVGTPAEQAWARLGEEPELAGLARCLLRADATGAPPASALARLAESARRAAASAAQARVRRAGVLVTAPLGLCFLPAFVLVGVVPVVTGLTGGFLSRF